MAGLLDLIDAVNVLSRVEAVIGALIYNERQSPRVSGTAALPSAHEIRVSRRGQFSGTDVQRLLRHYGVDVWGGRTTSDHFIMYVKERQATWAEYLLLRRGVSLEGPLHNPRNAVTSQDPGSADQPVAWADRTAPAKGGIERLLDLLR